MNRKILAALLAAGALLPAAADAQERGERGGWRGGGNRDQSAAPQSVAPQSTAPAPAPAPRFEGFRRDGNGAQGAPQGSGWQGQNRGAWQRPEGLPGGGWQGRPDGQPRQQPQAVPLPAPVPVTPPVQANPGSRGTWNGGDRGGFNGGDRGGLNGGDRGGLNGGDRNWRDNRPQQPATPPPQAQQPSSRGDWQSGRDGRDWQNGRDGRDNRDWQNGRDGRRDGNWGDNRGNDPRTAPRPQQGGRNDWRENRGWQNGRDGGWRGDREFNNWNRDWRRNNQYDWQRYRYQNRNTFRLPRYYAPRGWSYGYRRFGVGSILDQLLFGQNYWISDPWYYRLPPAYGPYRWVRYYNDAYLVDTYTGEVVDVIYDIFW